MENKKLRNIFLSILTVIGLFVGFKVIDNQNIEIKSTYNSSTIDSLTKDSTFFQLPDSLNNQE